jgi:restriction system protein
VPIAVDTSTWSLELLKCLDWKRFEELCTWYFQESGHTAKVTGAGADGGVDIWIYDAADAGTVSGVAQCKAWTDKQVGVKEVRELFGVMNHVGCRYGVFFGMSGFTIEARSFAANKEIDLVSAEQLLDLIAVLPREVQDKLLERATSGDYATPSCPSCGIKLVVRTAGKGARAGRQFWGCSNYPRCKYKMN